MDDNDEADEEEDEEVSEEDEEESDDESLEEDEEEDANLEVDPLNSLRGSLLKLLRVSTRQGDIFCTHSHKMLDTRNLSRLPRRLLRLTTTRLWTTMTRPTRRRTRRSLKSCGSARARGTSSVLTATRCSILEGVNAEATMPTIKLARFRSSADPLSSRAINTSRSVGCA
jgi:hypothetical protein